MFDLSVKIKGMKEVDGLLDGLADKMEEIQHFSIINAGEKARDAVTGQLIGVFDRPTYPIITAVRLADAKGGRVGRRTIGKPIGLWLKDVFRDKTGKSMLERVLGPHVFGEPRSAKPLEKRFRRANVLQQNEFLIPSRSAPLDRYGNVRRGVIAKILESLSAKSGKGGYIVGEIGKTKGIFKIHGGAGRVTAGRWKLIFLIVRGAPRYRKRLPFFEVGNNVFLENIDREFDLVYRRYINRFSR